MAHGSTTYWQNDYAATAESYQAGLDLYRAINDSPGTALALYNLAFVKLITGDASGSRPMFEESRSLYEALDDRYGLAGAAFGLGLAAMVEGDYELALRSGQEAHRTYDEVGDWYGKNNAVFVLYQVARLTGKFDRARALMLESLPFFVESKDITGIASLLEVMADVEVSEGEVERGLQLAGAADSIKTEYGGEAPPGLMELEDPRARATSMLAQDEIDSAWAVGKRMNLDQAVAFAQDIKASNM
jgi:tetratricopeptide (TPR) repeat protein